MAERRMFTDKITESDAFLDMPMTTQCLYFHLCMNADDDGFVKNPKRIQKMLGASEDDSKLLIAKAFVLPFDSGIVVIKHWRMHNLLRKDRYKATEYVEERSMLYLKENGAYTFDENQGKLLPATSESDAENNADNHLATNCQPTDNHLATQDRLGYEVSKYENKDIKIKDTIGRVHACESYQEVIDNMQVEEGVVPMIWNFIKHCQLNGKTLTNAKLTDILIFMDCNGYDERKKIQALKNAINGGYYDIKRG